MAKKSIWDKNYFIKGDAIKGYNQGMHDASVCCKEAKLRKECVAGVVKSLDVNIQVVMYGDVTPTKDSSMSGWNTHTDFYQICNH